MNTLKFANGLPQLFEDFPRSDHPRNRCFSRLLGALPGLASENKLMLLNHAASHLAGNEVYLEIGAWFGLSIIAAALGNRRTAFVTIDDFSEFGGSSSLLQRNLARFHVADHVAVIEADCFRLLRLRQPFGQRTVGVFFYDGCHTFDAQLQVLQLIKRHLSDRALIVIDDTSNPAVRGAIAHYTSFQPEYELLFDIPTNRDRDPRWWNGIQAFSFRRARARRHGRLLPALHQQWIGAATWPGSTRT